MVMKVGVGSNWHNEVFEQEGWFEMAVDAELGEFNGMVYCEDCYAIVGKLDECLCLVDRSDVLPLVVENVTLGRTKGVYLNCGSDGCCG